MDIVSNKELLLDAKKNQYAVPAFNVHNLETIQAVIEGAWEMKSPVIIATTPGTVNYAGLEYLVAILKAGAKKYKIPIALHLDHCTDIDFLKNCIKGGYKSVMIDSSMEDFDTNINNTKIVVDFAHKLGVSVESELGHIWGQEEEIVINKRDALLTDPIMALEFVKKTGVDSLAVAIGTAHGVYKLEPKLDFNRLIKMNKIIDVPLVLHGASGISEENIKKAIQYGICKVNIATEIKIQFAEAIKKYFKENPNADDPRNYLSPAKEIAKNVVKEKINICGSRNRI